MNSTIKNAGLRVQIPKPRKMIVPMTEGLAWRGGGNFLYIEKYDGQWVAGGLPFQGHLLLAERMQGGIIRPPNAVWYAVHSIAALAGQNVLSWPTRARWRELCALAPLFPPYMRLANAGNGGEFLQTVLDHGGEGVCAFDLDASWGEMWACKRLETFYCMVTGFCGGTQSVSVARLPEYQPGGNLDVQNRLECGHVALRGGKCDRVRIGSIIKVEGFGLTAAGMIREPRTCKDSPTSWLVKF